MAALNVTEMHFLDYLGVEERNLLASIVNFRTEFDMFHAVDEIYRTPLARMTVGEEQVLVPQLFLFVHFHLYFSVSCVLRSHLSDALSSVRKAIDAGLTAYALILDPGKSEAYLNGDAYFRYIKAKIRAERKKDAGLYPLAAELLNIHEPCSEFGSHADISSFFHRLEAKNKIHEKGGGTVLVHYFQFPRNSDEYRFYFLVVLQAFFLLFHIFKVFFDGHFKIVDPGWEGRISELGPALDRRRQAAYERFNKEA